jgi:hypothetical protein
VLRERERERELKLELELELALSLSLVGKAAGWSCRCNRLSERDIAAAQSPVRDVEPVLKCRVTLADDCYSCASGTE